MPAPHTIQTVGAIMMVMGSLALLYPRIIHPVVSNMFSDKPDNVREVSAEEYMNPHLRRQMEGHPARAMNAFPGAGGMPRPHMPNSRSGGGVPGHMRGGMEGRSSHTGASSGRGGVTAMVLPVYAVGIIGYLFYILFKVFIRKQKSDGGPTAFNENPRFREQLRRVRYDGDSFNLGDDFRSEDDVRQYLSRQRRQNQLGETLGKACETKADQEEMEMLRARLAETEAQMERIMQAMNAAQVRINAGVTEEQTPASEDTPVEEDTASVEDVSCEAEDHRMDARRESENEQTACNEEGVHKESEADTSSGTDTDEVKEVEPKESLTSEAKQDQTEGLRKRLVLSKGSEEEN